LNIEAANEAGQVPGFFVGDISTATIVHPQIEDGQ
jgi:hypothetical protein